MKAFCTGLGHSGTLPQVHDEPLPPQEDQHHVVTVVWDPANLDEASENLAATITATIPTEAKMTDEGTSAAPLIRGG
jgi:hypothetical protein